MNKEQKKLNDSLFDFAVGLVKVQQLMLHPINYEKLEEDARDVANEQAAARGEED